MIDRILKNNIYLPIEIKRRELYSRIYFAVRAATKGYKVTIGRKNRFHEFNLKIKPGNYISKSIGISNFDHIKKLKDRGHKIFYIDEEGLMSFNKEFTHRRLTEEGLQLVDIIFTWGNNHNKELMNLYPNLKEKLRIIGNPRFDILKNRAKEFYSEEIQKIKNTYGDFFLLATKFGKTNHVKRKNINDYYTNHVSKGFLKTDELKSICKKSIKHEEENFKNFLEFIKLFNQVLTDKKLVILVHPAEDTAVYEEIINNMTNVKIARGECSSNSWILSSELIIQNNCTTALEAYLMGIKPIQLNFYQDKDVEYLIPKKISHTFLENEKLIYFLKEYKKENFTNSNKFINDLKFINEYIDNIKEENSVDLILKNLFNEFNIAENNLNILKSFEKVIYSLKMSKRLIKNYITDKSILKMSKSKFSSLDINEIKVFMEKIIQVENYKLDEFKLTESFPGLFTIEYIK